MGVQHILTVKVSVTTSTMLNFDGYGDSDVICKQTFSVLLGLWIQNVVYFTEEGGLENVNPRPVTALQRQREREEKRRKKAEKAAERKKKSKAAKGNGLLLQTFLSN